MEKKCTKCGEIKDVSEFHRNKNTKDGYVFYCKTCMSSYTKGELHTPLSRKISLITREKILDVLSYDTDTGLFTCVKTGEGCHAQGFAGYKVVRIGKETFMQHRLAWFLHSGDWAEEVDHKNGNISDNSIANLRGCNKRENLSNTSDTRGGHLLGAYYDSNAKKYRASICVDGVRTNLGVHPTERQASLAYCTHVLKHGLMRREFLPAEFTDEELGISK